MPAFTDVKPTPEYFGENKIKLSEIELLIKESGIEMHKIMLLTVDSAGNIFMIPKEAKK